TSMEGHIVRDVPAVDRDVPAAVPIVMGLIMKSVLEQTRIGPGVSEIILRARTESGREFLAVHKELLIALAPPATPRVPNVQHHADEPAGAFGLEHRPIDLAVGGGRQKRIAMPLGMEPGQLLERT